MHLRPMSSDDIATLYSAIELGLPIADVQRLAVALAELHVVADLEANAVSSRGMTSGDDETSEDATWSPDAVTLKPEVRR